ncbi:MAG: hypothetical protein CML51_05910 [Rhodobacteraceae bacterium]|nr:hypothetical protein [Paracoccaceae bacterium]
MFGEQTVAPSLPPCGYVQSDAVLQGDPAVRWQEHPPKRHCDWPALGASDAEVKGTPDVASGSEEFLPTLGPI